MLHDQELLASYVLLRWRNQDTLELKVRRFGFQYMSKMYLYAGAPKNIRLMAPPRFCHISD